VTTIQFQKDLDRQQRNDKKAQKQSEVYQLDDVGALRLGIVPQNINSFFLVVMRV
jgi:hypothetical protein